MAKQVVWSPSRSIGQKRNLEILAERNKSNAYGKKLNQLFRAAIKIVTDFPQIGKPTDDIKAKVKIVKDYLILYEETDTQILILTIWDSRQNPEGLRKILR